MMQNDPLVDAINRRVNTVAAIKQYQHIKNLMADFTEQERTEPEQSARVDQRIN
ncbi:hypothetical protein [Hydrogenispora ethanolica]|uniref:hypothetical protein n=1 Tax=Hydrogenispora ethanolica TaxID=1082276 RepID=UPI001A9E94BB|nr:hypothetical protein [Hydrogenispora ethanolica]